MILSIDVGTRNLGWCTWDEKCVDFGIIDLMALKKGTDYAAKVKRLHESGFFDNADTILCEIQMRSCMKTIATAIRCLEWDKTVRVAPQRIKRHFASATGKHRSNKKAAVAIAQRYLSGALLDKFMKLKKKDDIADAILQCVWYTSQKK